jgi:uncharacterized protein YlxW (UPF0749 family)
MKKILVLFVSLFLFFACNTQNESDKNVDDLKSDELTNEKVDLEEDLGELENELEESKDSLKK